MKILKALCFSPLSRGMAVLAILCVPQCFQAQQNWKATVGGQSKDMGKQAMAFLPNEIWVHAGDTITWTSASNDIHTITFLKAGQPVPPFQVGCPGFSSSGTSFTGSTCATSPPFVKGQSFGVTFPVSGNYKLVCLVHSHMTGVVHVLNASAILPHDQAFYDEQGDEQQSNLLADTDRMTDPENGRDMGRMVSARVLSSKNGVPAGTGEMASTAGGFQSLSVMRFLHGTIEVDAGDTVEWTNLDPATPHTITFGSDPRNPFPPTPNVFRDPDGALHAIITSPADSVHSGIIVAAAQDRIGVRQSPPGVTRFRITFPKAGTYPYQCALHDNLGMVGKVIVRP